MLPLHYFSIVLKSFFFIKKPKLLVNYFSLENNTFSSFSRSLPLSKPGPLKRKKANLKGRMFWWQPLKRLLPISSKEVNKLRPRTLKSNVTWSKPFMPFKTRGKLWVRLLENLPQTPAALLNEEIWWVLGYINQTTTITFVTFQKKDVYAWWNDLVY